jgi:hypothetical protein
MFIFTIRRRKMKRHIITTSTALAAIALIFIGASFSTASITTENTTDTAETVLGHFQVIPMELPEIEADNTATMQHLFDGTFERLLEEKTAFLQETRPLKQMLKSKWAALTDELTSQAPETVTTTCLQEEISALDTRLAEMRVEHLMALNNIKTNPVN